MADKLARARTRKAVANFDLHTLPTTDPVYAEAFRRIFQKRLDAVRAGMAAGTSDAMLDFSYATGDPNFGVLLQDYMRGYNHALQSKRQLVTSNMTS